MTDVAAVDLLVSGGPLLTMDSQGSFFLDGAVAIDGGRIVTVGSAKAVTSSVSARAMLHASGKAILPGFVNCHGHTGLILLRGLAEEFPLQPWLVNTVWPVMRFAGPEETYIAARLACLEMIRSGITTFTDMWRDLPAVEKAVEESGLRARLAFNMRDYSDPALLEPEWRAGLEAIETPVRTPFIKHGLAPHSLYACSNEILRRCAEEVEKIGCHLQIHIAETQLEVSESLQKHGCTPVERLDELRLLGPHTLLAHGVWMNETDCARAARARAAVSHNVTSNMKLASGIAPLARFRSAGLNLALGTDSAASNNVLDPFREMKFALLAQRASTGDVANLTPRMALEAATLNGARALGMADEIGSLEPGKQADMILIDLDKPHFAPARPNDADALMASIVFCAGASDVDTVIVGGRIIMRNREVSTLEAQLVRESASAASQRLLSRANR